MWGMQDETLSTGEAAKLFGVAPRTMRDWCDNGKIPFWRSPSGRRRISCQVVDAMLKEREAAING